MKAIKSLLLSQGFGKFVAMLLGLLLCVLVLAASITWFRDNLTEAPRSVVHMADFNNLWEENLLQLQVVNESEEYRQFRERLALADIGDWSSYYFRPIDFGNSWSRLTCSERDGFCQLVLLVHYKDEQSSYGEIFIQNEAILTSEPAPPFFAHYYTKGEWELYGGFAWRQDYLNFGGEEAAGAAVIIAGLSILVGGIFGALAFEGVAGVQKRFVQTDA